MFPSPHHLRQRAPPGRRVAPCRTSFSRQQRLLPSGYSFSWGWFVEMMRGMSPSRDAGIADACWADVHKEAAELNGSVQPLPRDSGQCLGTELPCRYEGPVREMESGVDDDVMRHGSKSVGIEGYSHPLSCTRVPFDEKTGKEDSMPMSSVRQKLRRQAPVADCEDGSVSMAAQMRLCSARVLCSSERLDRRMATEWPAAAPGRQAVTGLARQNEAECWPLMNPDELCGCSV